jgi:hypothetical protein
MNRINRLARFTLSYFCDCDYIGGHIKNGVNNFFAEFLTGVDELVKNIGDVQKVIFLCTLSQSRQVKINTRCETMLKFCSNPGDPNMRKVRPSRQEENVRLYAIPPLQIITSSYRMPRRFCGISIKVQGPSLFTTRRQPRFAHGP